MLSGVNRAMQSHAWTARLHFPETTMQHTQLALVKQKSMKNQFIRERYAIESVFLKISDCHIEREGQPTRDME
jgi:hypothetical protein